jgi:hypothetical protein
MTWTEWEIITLNERLIPYDLTHMLWSLKVDLIEIESGMVIAKKWSEFEGRDAEPLMISLVLFF